MTLQTTQATDSTCRQECSKPHLPAVAALASVLLILAIPLSAETPEPETPTAKRIFSPELTISPGSSRSFTLGVSLPAANPLALEAMLGGVGRGPGGGWPGLPASGLHTGFRLGVDERGRLQALIMGDLSRQWDDLDGWEKFGVVLQTSAAAAGAVMLVNKLAEKIK